MNAKKERNRKKALARSQRNQVRRQVTNARQRRREARKEQRKPQGLRLQWNEQSTVAHLRACCDDRGIKTTTKMRKSELIELLAGES